MEIVSESHSLCLSLLKDGKEICDVDEIRMSCTTSDQIVFDSHSLCLSLSKDERGSRGN